MCLRSLHTRISLNGHEVWKYCGEADPPMINGRTPRYNIIITHECKTTFSLTHRTMPHMGSPTISHNMNASESQYPVSKWYQAHPGKPINLVWSQYCADWELMSSIRYDHLKGDTVDRAISNDLAVSEEIECPVSMALGVMVSSTFHHNVLPFASSLDLITQLE